MTDAAQGPQTVADALQSVDLSPDYYHNASGYEAYLRPLKLTAGALCLQIGSGDSPWYVAYREPDELYQVDTGNRVHAWEMHEFIKSYERDVLELRPRLTREVR
jgi:hypothetical protein